MKDSKAPEVPPPDKKTAKVAGFGIDDILKAPVTPPTPDPESSGPDVVDKIDQAGYQASAQIGPKKPHIENLVIAGLGVFILLIGLLGFVFFNVGTALAIVAIGFIFTVIGSFVKF